jgi:hypothetical protein
VFDVRRCAALALHAAETIPSYTFTEADAKVLAKAVAYAEWRSKPFAMVPGFVPYRTTAL